MASTHDRRQHQTFPFRIRTRVPPGKDAGDIDALLPKRRGAGLASGAVLRLEIKRSLRGFLVSLPASLPEKENTAQSFGGARRERSQKSGEDGDRLSASSRCARPGRRARRASRPRPRRIRDGAAWSNGRRPRRSGGRPSGNSREPRPSRDVGARGQPLPAVRRLRFRFTRSSLNCWCFEGGTAKKRCPGGPHGGDEKDPERGTRDQTGTPLRGIVLGRRSAGEVSILNGLPG
jgi:hypothetical protein